MSAGVVSLVRFGSIAKVRDGVGPYMNPPGHALVYALNTATIGGTALTGNQLISEISAYVTGRAQHDRQVRASAD